MIVFSSKSILCKLITKGDDVRKPKLQWQLEKGLHNSVQLSSLFSGTVSQKSSQQTASECSSKTSIIEPTESVMINNENITPRNLINAN